MSNVLQYGFRAYRHRSGSMPKPLRCRVATGYQASVGGNVNLSPGDPVKRLSTGYFALAAQGDAVWGVMVGVDRYYDGTRMRTNSYLPGGTAYGTVLERTSTIFVQPVDGTQFAVAADDGVTFTTEATFTAALGENADVVNVGDSTNARANPQLDISTHATSNALVWRIADIVPRVDIDFTSQYVDLIVECNLTQLAPYQTTGT